MRCFRCKKPISKVWAVINGHVYGPDCAHKVIGVNTTKRISSSKVKWYLPSDSKRSGDDTLPLFEEGEI